jgi:glycerophosphoryl diester phosphodiesterase
MLFLRFRRVRKHFRFVLKPAIAFEFWSTLIFMVSLVPASGWLLNRLVASSGQYAVSDNDLIAFFLSPPGLLFLILSLGFVLAFWFAEQVGLLIISVNAVFQNKIYVSHVLWEQIKNIPALIRLGLLQAAVYLVASIPFVLGIGLTYLWLLRDWDLYYYLNVKPLSWYIAVTIAGTFLATYLLLAAWLYIRWLFSIPFLVFGDVTPTGALRKSWQQTRGRFWELLLPLSICWAVVIISSLVIALLVRTAAVELLEPAELTLKFVVPVVVGTLALIAVLDAIWFIIGKIMHVWIIADFYSEMMEAKQKPSAPAPAAGILSPSGVKRIGWLIAGIVLIMGVAAGTAFIRDFKINSAVEITGHRGSKLKAPENTLSALRQAIAEGADYAEIDVQTTADGTVVLLHDADLMRVASVNRRLRDINYSDLKDIDVGTWFMPEFSGERIPTLQEAIDLARGHIKLNIELKFNWPDPTLSRKVGDIIQQNGFISECVVSSLNFQALTEIKQALPTLKTGLIVLQAVGNLSRMEVDFLSINASRVTPRLVRDVHRRGDKVHVWTVNDLNNVISMIEMGVDNIITDYPQKLRRFLEAWNSLSDGEKIVLMLRKFIVGIEGPEPSKL